MRVIDKCIILYSNSFATDNLTSKHLCIQFDEQIAACQRFGSLDGFSLFLTICITHGLVFLVGSLFPSKACK